MPPPLSRTASCAVSCIAGSLSAPRGIPPRDEPSHTALRRDRHNHPPFSRAATRQRAHSKISPIAVPALLIASATREPQLYFSQRRIPAVFEVVMPESTAEPALRRLIPSSFRSHNLTPLPTFTHTYTLSSHQIALNSPYYSLSKRPGLLQHRDSLYPNLRVATAQSSSPPQGRAAPRVWVFRLRVAAER